MTVTSPHTRPNDNDLHGPVHERLSHAHYSAALLIEYLDEFAGEVHPDFVAQFWASIRTHATRRLTDVTPIKA